MEFDRTLFDFQRILKNTEEDLNVKFENLGPDDSRNINNALDAIYDTHHDWDIERNRYKVHLLLFLNTNTECRNKIADDKSFGHLVGKFPTLSKTFYFRLVMKLNLQSYMKDLVMYSCPAICSEIVQLINDELKYMPLQERLDMLEIVLNGLYFVISRNLSSESNISIVNKLYDLFQMVCLHFNCMSNDNSLKDTSQYIGMKLMTFLKLLRSFLNKNANDVKVEFPEIEMSTDFTTTERTKADIYDIVAGKCSDCIKQLDINLMLHWHEIDYVSGATLQNSIGENAYHLWETLKQGENPTNCVSLLIQLLPVILIKPKDKVDFTKLSIDEILHMVESGSEFSSICTEILLTKSDIFVNEKFVEMLKINVSDFDFELTEQICTILYSEILKESDENISSVLKGLFMFVMNTTNIDNCLHIINVLNETHESRELIEIDENEIRKNLLIIDQILLNPINKEMKEETLRQSLVYAFMNNFGFLFALMNLVRHHVGCWEAINEVLRVIEPVYSCTKEGKPDILTYVIISTIKSFNEFPAREVILVIKFIELSKEFINLDNMLSSLLPLLQPQKYPDQDFMTGNYLSICRLLIGGTRFKRDIHYLYALAIAQIMDNSRWTMDDFGSGKMHQCTQAIELLNIIISRLKQFIDEEQENCKKRWLISRVNKLSNYTKSYFTALFPSCETHGLETRLLLLIHGVKTRFTDQDRSELSVVLSKVLSTCSYEELHLMVMNYVWADAAESQQRAKFIFRSICDGVSLLKILKRRSVNVESYNKCFQNVIHVVTKLIEAVYVPLISSSSDDNMLQVIYLIKFLLAICKDLPNSLRLPISFNVVKILSDVLATLENSIDYNMKFHINLVFALASNIK